MTSKEPIKCIKSFLPDEDCYSCSSCMYYTESDCVGYGDKCYLKQAFNFLNKENTPLSECIKEWEEEGFQVDKYQDYLLMIDNYCSTNKEADEVEFNIDLSSKQVSMPNGCWAKLPFKIYHLLSKTLKALEAEE